MKDQQEKLRKHYHLPLQQKNKIPRNKPTKGGKILYSENYKILMKDIKDDNYGQRDLPFSWIRRINIVNMIMLPKVTYRFDAVHIKLPMALSQS